MEKQNSSSTPQEITQKVNEFTKHIQGKIWETQLEQSNPPYFPQYFSKWRQQSLISLIEYIKNKPFEEQNIYIREFIYQVDYKYIQDFFIKIKPSYFEKVYLNNYGVPGSVNIFKIKNENDKLDAQLKRLAQQIAEWCIQIEVSTDMIERAEILGLYQSEQTNQDVYQNLKVQLNGEKEKTYLSIIGSLFKKGVSYGMKQLSSIMWDKGIAQANITYATAVILYYTFMGTGSLPLQIIFPKSKILYLVGGVVGSFAVGQMAEQLDTSEIQYELEQLTEGFKDICINLTEFNQRCRRAIDACFRSKNQDEFILRKKELKLEFKELLEHTENFKNQKDDIFKIKELVEREIDDGWVVLEKQESDNQQQQQLEQQQQAHKNIEMEQKK